METKQNQKGAALRPRPPTIAIDGPVAAGKTAVGAEVARRLGYRFLDTGSMYRAFTWFILERGINPDDAERLQQAASSVRLTVTGVNEHARILVDGEDATPHLTSARVESAVSQVSRVPAVRRAMVDIQRAAAAGGGVVMAGRDIGTVVLPDAGLKVYLNASREERARRRQEQMALRGEETSFETVLADLTRRDAIDSNREASPLRPARDAVIIDSDGLTLEQVVERVISLLP
ncbi:MAG: (d)CMP kinase [Dehalococcoidia bacterium]|nr:(d)CMP kinase [Dehalococcoidia bacterium]